MVPIQVHIFKSISREVLIPVCVMRGKIRIRSWFIILEYSNIVLSLKKISDLDVVSLTKLLFPTWIIPFIHILILIRWFMICTPQILVIVSIHFNLFFTKKNSFRLHFSLPLEFILTVILLILLPSSSKE